MKWYEEPMVISAIQCNYTDSFEVLRDFTGPHFNAEQLMHTHAQDFNALYDEAIHGEKLTQYLKESREKGIREIIYYNVHCILMEGANKHPEWLLRGKDGKHITAYDNEAYVCTNEAYTAEVVSQLRNLCHHDIDGIFLDGPIATGACYCKDCVAKFEAQYGKSQDEATHEELLKFNISKVNAFMKACHDAVKSVNPEVMLYINNSALRADITGSNTREVYDYVDFLGAEGGFVWVSKSQTNWHVSPMAKIIETQAQGKPCVTFIAGDYKPWSYCMHTAEETTLYYAQALANGTNVWYGVHGPISQAFGTPGGQTALKLNKFILDNKAVYTKHKPVSKVALMWSQNSANYYKSSVNMTDFTAAQTVGAGEDSKSDHYKSFFGCFEMLVRNHIQHDVIDEISILKDELSKYDLLIMPTAACLTDEAAEKIRAYVANGGTLITTYDTGFYEANGLMAKAPKLADVQGIKAINKLVRYKVSGSGYQRAVGDNAYMKNTSWKYLPGVNFAADVAVCDDAVVCAECSEPMPSRYEKFPEVFFPAIIEHTYGKGKSIYFTGDIGEFNHVYSNPDIKTVFINAVNACADPIVTTDAPGSVEIVLRKCQEGYALHCINFTGEMERPINRIIELENVTVHMNITDVEGVVASITDAQAVNVEKTETGIRFTIPRMKEYEVFTIK